ncbi:TetR/AcrR family transcriptional regulator [Paenibacillus koleovorans]|uniref:TetR/AcrR family transcriptional regulator n=1 Tax=Paenibacillus koleovorans TaxID=121608 RepID=UPI000FDB8D25|nr:TetR/AcrR family transcriptional regulator [Paenibacillus koleovorans]
MSVDRKASVLEAAEKSFTLFGYKATTMDQVAKIANVGKGTIYTFFKNKEELFDEILRKLIAEMKAVAERVLHPDKTFIENLQAALYALLDFRRSHELTLKLTHEVRDMGTPQAQEAIREIESAVLGFITRKVQEAVDQGYLRPCDPKITAFVMLKLYIAFIYEWDLTHEPLSKEQIYELFQLYLLEGLSP